MNRDYFVTGATGTVGSALVSRLIADPDTRVWALMRAQSAQHLQSRLRDLNSYWRFDSEQLARVTPLGGDVELERFGLDDTTYAELARTCTHIVHCAGVVRMNLPMETARKHAVGSAREILRLANTGLQDGKLRKVEFVSTVGVGGRMRGPVPESWVVETRDFHNTYEASKAEAEDLLRNTIEQHGLPIAVHRPSMVVGNSTDGRVVHFQIFYYLCEFISGRQTKGLLPHLGDNQLDTVPVDYVADVLHWSSNTNCTTGEILHLSSGPEMSIELRQLQVLVRTHFEQAGVRLPSVVALPAGLFRVLVSTLSKLSAADKRRKLAAVPIFLDYLRDRQWFPNDATTALLKTHKGPTLAHPDSYLGTVLHRYLEATGRQ